MFDEAVRVVLETKRGSVSLLQRRLSVGYARASRMIEMMAAAGILGEYKGSQAREVLMTLEDYEEMRQQMDAEAQPAFAETPDSCARAEGRKRRRHGRPAGLPFQRHRPGRRAVGRTRDSVTAGSSRRPPVMCSGRIQRPRKTRAPCANDHVVRASLSLPLLAGKGPGPSRLPPPSPKVDWPCQWGLRSTVTPFARIPHFLHASNKSGAII